MITIESRLFVDGLTDREVFDFLLNATDEDYRRWWPGTHLRLHALERHEDHVGDVFYMDEYIGKRRVRMTGVVAEAERGRRIVWRLGRRVPLPVRLTLEMTDRDGGVALRHTIRAGFGGIGRVLDPLFRLYFSQKFAAAMDEHARAEFPMLRDLLAGSSPARASNASADRTERVGPQRRSDTLGEVTRLEKNLWYVQGEMPEDSRKDPDPCNVVVYKADDRLYLIDSSSGPKMRESIEGVLRQAGPVESFTLINTHSHLDHICNNDLIDTVDAGIRHHYILQSGVPRFEVDAPGYFAEQFEEMDEYFDPFTSYQVDRWKYRFVGILRDTLGMFVGRKRVLRFLFGVLFKKFGPINDSRATMEPLGNLPARELIFGGATWHGWVLGQNDVYVLEGRAHTDDEVFVYVPEHRALVLGDSTFPLFPTWENSDKDRILDCLEKSLSMVKSGSVDVLADGHSDRCYVTRDDMEALLETTIADHLRYEEILRDVFEKEDGLTPGEVYERFREYDEPVVEKYLGLEFPHSPPSLQNVMVTTLLQMGYEARGERRHKRFYRRDEPSPIKPARGRGVPLR